MANNVDVNIRGNDTLSPAMAQARKKVEAEANKLRGNVQGQFRQLGQNILSQVGGPLGMVANQLGGIQHPVGIAIASITALAGGFLSLARRTAEVNAAVSTDSRSLLVGFENLRQRINDNLNIIGGKGISIFNTFFNLIGVGATKQQLLNAETKRYNELIINTVKQTDEYIAKIKEFIVASDRLDEATITRDYFEAIAKGRTDLANAYFRQLSNIKILDAETKSAAANEKELFEENAHKRKELEEEAARRRKELAEDIMGAIKKLGETERDEMRKSIEAADRALQRDRTEFQEELERQRARIKSPEDVERSVNEERERANNLLRQEVQLAAELANNMLQAALNAKDFSDFVQQAIRLIQNIVLSQISSGSFLSFQHGGIVRRPTRALIGEAGPEAVVPLSPGKASQREAVMQAAGLTNNSVTLNFSMPNVRSVDQIAIRNELLPAINRQIRRGEKLIASKLR